MINIKDTKMSLKKYVCFGVFAFLLTSAATAQEQPVDKIKKIGDKLIRETPFTYRLTLPSREAYFKTLHLIDFGRSFGTGKKAMAYAFTQLTFPKDTLLTVEVAHNDACKIWCNGALVYEKEGNRDIEIVRDERSMQMADSFALPLKKGNNTVLIKSQTAGKDWSVFLQPPSEKDAVVTAERNYPEIGLKYVKNIDPEVAALTDWLVIGPFAPGMDIVHEPEKTFSFGYMYKGLYKPVTWTIPKTEVLGDVVGAKTWGTTYQWNYHNGGVAWAMQVLGMLTGEQKYKQWGTHFCDYHMEGMPFVNYQVNELKAYNSANALVINSSLLDFTLAPSLPIIYRLRTEQHFKNDSIYRAYISKMMRYARFGQIRSKGFTNYTRATPEAYTVWADDMFMGIPFLVQAGLYSGSPEVKKAFLDDAANQLIDFNKQVWDPEARLYMHANYSSRPQVKLPYWSRANGWAIWALSEVLMALPKNHPKYKAILQQYRVFVNSLIRYQSADGFWHNVIDRPDSPEEVSGTAIFTMAMARGVRFGWLNQKQFEPIVKKGWQAVASEIEEDGTVHKICIGTMCSEDINYYMNRPFYDNDTHGSFAVIFAGIEVQQMLDRSDKKLK